MSHTSGCSILDNLTSSQPQLLTRCSSTDSGSQLVLNCQRNDSAAKDINLTNAAQRPLNAGVVRQASVDADGGIRNSGFVDNFAVQRRHSEYVEAYADMLNDCSGKSNARQARPLSCFVQTKLTKNGYVSALQGEDEVQGPWQNSGQLRQEFAAKMAAWLKPLK